MKYGLRWVQMTHLYGRPFVHMPPCSMSVEYPRVLFKQDPRHKVHVDLQACVARLRHKPDFKWCCQWIVDDAWTKDHLLKRSYVLGPQKFPYVHAKAPSFHIKDAVLLTQPFFDCSSCYCLTFFGAVACV